MDFVNIFSAFIEMTVFFYIYSVTAHSIVLIYYCMLNQPCVHTWSWCTVLFIMRFAAAAAVPSVVSDSVQPQRRQPTRLPCLWDSPGKNTGVGCHFPLRCMRVKSESEVAQSCPTLQDPMDCSPPGSSVYGIFQARVLEWGAIAFSHY